MSKSPADHKDIKPVLTASPIKSKVGRRDLSYLMERSDDSDCYSGLTQLKKLVQCSAGLEQGTPILKWTNDTRTQLAKLYQQHPELWCPTDPKYIEPYSNGSVQKRKQKIAEITKALPTSYTHEQVRTEIQSLRMRYKNYLVEMMKNKNNGDPVQLPNWPVFNHLKFLTHTVLNEEDLKKIDSAKRKRVSTSKESSTNSPASAPTPKRARNRAKKKQHPIESIIRFSEFVVDAFQRIARSYPERVVELSRSITEILRKMESE
uniref:MADF domain-containing protein n=1 Tax=Ditylenchus dipsaci TaxID=166011 RepID=A0A915DP16_9BILA